MATPLVCACAPSTQDLALYYRDMFRVVQTEAEELKAQLGDDVSTEVDHEQQPAPPTQAPTNASNAVPLPPSPSTPAPAVASSIPVIVVNPKDPLNGIPA